MTEELHRKFTFRIEQKPDGGYVLHSDNPPVHIEGATKEEVEEKLKADFMKLMPEGVAKKLLDLSQMAGVQVKTNVNVKTEHIHLSNADIDSAPALSGGPKAEPLISPKLIVILLVLLGIALMVWRAMPHH